VPPYRVFEKDQRVTHTAIVESKRLSEALSWVREMQGRQLPAARIKTNSEQFDYVSNSRRRDRPRGP
jgi:hypothetical protein